MWIARDRNGLLKLFSHKPKRLKSEGRFAPVMPYHQYMSMPVEMWREITWENSPVRMKLVTDDEKLNTYDIKEED